MTDAQTEARAIAQTSLWVPAKPEHAKIGWTYDFEQTERISRAAYDSTGYNATMEVVEFVMAEADRRHRDALSAKDAELAAAHQRYVDANEARIDAEAQLAEARKALGLMLRERDILSGNFGDVVDLKHRSPDRWPTAAEAARRALEAQGGE